MNSIENQIKRFFIATDACDWETVVRIFDDNVELDYQSMNGQPPAIISGDEIVGSWKGLLSGFDHTHHQIGNMIVAQEGDLASVFCYGTATHFIGEAEGGELWTVVGSYDFDLARKEDTWHITKQKFNFKYQSGNSQLPAIAMEAAKQ